MAVTVRFFAALREAAGTSQVEVIPGPLPQIVEDLCARYGDPFATRAAIATGLLNGQPVQLDRDVDVEDGAELALLPPFSGGSAVAAHQRRVEHLLLAGSVLVPGLLVLGAYVGRWAFGTVVLVVALGSLIDLHNALGDAGLRTVLPTGVALAVGPALLILLVPSLAQAWIPGIIALGVMVTFLLALASERRQETATIVGSTLLAAFLVGIGAAALLMLHDVVSADQVAWALGLIALADVTTSMVARRSFKLPSRAMMLAAVGPAALAAVGMSVVVTRAAPAMPVGFALAAAVAALTTARLRHLLRQPESARPALWIGTADAVLIGAPLTLVWTRLVIA